jgi:hypothetical protein
MDCGKHLYNKFPLMCEVREANTMEKIHYNFQKWSNEEPDGKTSYS